MVQICNQSGQPEAYLVKNIIIKRGNLNAIGVVLGNCVFNKKGLYVGKTRRHCIYNQQGEIMGMMLQNETEQDAGSSKLINEGWNIVQQIKAHGCMWIEEKREWADTPFEEVFE